MSIINLTRSPVDNLLMGSFDWQHEEEQIKETFKTTGGGAGRPNQQIPFKWLWVVLAVVLIISGMFYLRVRYVENQLADDVIESWNIIALSENTNDEELFANQLFGSDLHWILTQKSMLEKEYVQARGALFFFEYLADDEQNQPNVVFSDDLSEAVLSRPVAYIDAWQRTINLIQEDVFRKGEDRWLLAPPEESYWGAEDHLEITFESERFIYSAPEKDLELAQEIIAGFERSISTICEQHLPETCQKSQLAKEKIVFTPRMNNTLIHNRYHFGLTTILPAPSLIGTPETSSDVSMLVDSYELGFCNQYIWKIFESQGLAFHTQQSMFRFALLSVIYEDVGLYPERGVAFYESELNQFGMTREIFDQTEVVANLDSLQSGGEYQPFNAMISMIEFRQAQTGMHSQELLDFIVDNDTTMISKMLVPADEWDNYYAFLQEKAGEAN
ncbi:MAG: hypothetical protein AAF902_04615 [Chloroflexota bacterium]